MGRDDLRACAQLPIDALLFPKVSSRQYVEEIDELLRQYNPDMPIWIMIETPTALIDMEQFAGHPRVQVLVMGTSDLVQELRATHTTERHNLGYALQRSAGYFDNKKFSTGCIWIFVTPIAFKQYANTAKRWGLMVRH